jgi:hypothetical protein
MNDRHRNPHTFDMNNYYTGMTFVIGGRDFEREEKEINTDKLGTKSDKKPSVELDWSFLKKFPKTHAK